MEKYELTLIDFVATVEFICPFCGLKCSILNPPGLAHVEPACATFVREEPTEFLLLVNAKLRESETVN